MTTTLLVARIVLGGVFLFAGIAKLRDRVGTRRSTMAFGVSDRVARVVALLLPVAEVSLALALLPALTAAWAATSIGGLLAAFTIAITAKVMSGKPAPCNCFGSAGTSPVGWTSIARNVVLGAMAALIAWPKADGAGPSVVAWWNGTAPGARPAVVLATAALLGCVVLTRMCLHLIGEHKRLVGYIDALERARPKVPEHEVHMPSDQGTASQWTSIR